MVAALIIALQLLVGSPNSASVAPNSYSQAPTTTGIIVSTDQQEGN